MIAQVLVDVPRLAAGGERFRDELAPGALDLDPESELVRPVSVVAFDIRVEIVSGELLARGSVGTRLTFVCSRCAEWFEREIRVPDFFADIELATSPEQVDLTPEVRDAIILALPAYPLCSDACRGLCPQCGRNLNRERCSCRPPSDARWGVLDSLGSEP